MNEYSCERFADRLVDYADGELPAAESAAVAEHVARCPRCRETLEALRRSLALAGTIWRAGEEDVAAVRIPVPARPSRIWLLRPVVIAASIVLLVGVGVWLGRGWPGHRPDLGPDVAAASERIQTQCVVGNAVVIEHLASLVGQRGVLVVWSCRGADLTAARLSDALSDGGRTIDYSERVLAREQTADGRIVVWSLFVAPADVAPALEPPSIRVSTPDGRLLVLKTSPHVDSREELTDVLRSAGLPGRQRASLEDIEWVMGGT